MLSTRGRNSYKGKEDFMSNEVPDAQTTLTEEETDRLALAAVEADQISDHGTKRSSPRSDTAK